MNPGAVLSDDALKDAVDRLAAYYGPHLPPETIRPLIKAVLAEGRRLADRATAAGTDRILIRPEALAVLVEFAELALARPTPAPPSRPDLETT